MSKVSQYIIQNPIYFLLISLVVLGINACSPVKYLNDGELLVKKVTIELENYNDDYRKDRLKNGLSYYVQQRKNGRTLFIPKEYIYLSHNEPHDTSKYDKAMRNVVGEEPSIYDENTTLESVDRMKSWLRFSKGYYNAEVSHDIIKRGRYVEVIYTANLGERYKYGDIEFLSKDTAILNEVIELWYKDQPIRKGDYVDRDRFNTKRSQITNALQNRGYVDFASKYIDIKGDSTTSSKIINAYIEIYPPEYGGNHRIYTIGDINVYTDYYNKQDTFSLSTLEYNDVHYIKESESFLVKPKVLDKVILMKEGQVARKEERLRTFTKLSNLTTYRFTSINPKVNPDDSTKIDYDVQLTPHPYKWFGDYGADLLYSRLSTNVSSSLAGRNVLGMSLNGQLTNRNFLGGSEQYTISGELGGQIELTNPIRLRTYNYNLSNYLEFPTFNDHLKQVAMLHSLGFVRKSSYQFLKDKAQSTVNLSFSNNDFTDLYQIFVVSGSYGYKLPSTVDRSFNINTLGITLNSYELRDSFLNIINNNQFIINTFQDNLFTGFLFRNLFYSKNGYFPNSSYQWAFYLNAEMSGLEVLGVNKLSNAISASDAVWRDPTGRFSFAKFGKIELDGRLYKNLGKKHVLSGRLSGGIIVPFADSESAPFIKQFDAGGPNSMRGWGQRELGPGANQISLNSNVLPFQKGDIKLEANFEYRFPIWVFIKGGLFTDVGNIWTLRDDGDQGKFTSSFYEQIAVAAGYGIRFDFDYFLIRFDFGYRLRNPYMDEFGDHWSTIGDLRSQGIGNLQVNVNHAF